MNKLQAFMLGGLFFVLALFSGMAGFWMLEPTVRLNEIIDHALVDEFGNRPAPPLHAGDTMYVWRKMRSYDDDSERTITRYFVRLDSGAVLFRKIGVSVPPPLGVSERIITIELPKSMKPGRYALHTMITYFLNPIQGNVSYEMKSLEFEVVP